MKTIQTHNSAVFMITAGLLLLLLFPMHRVYAIFPPLNPGPFIADRVLEQIKEDPGLFMPGEGYTKFLREAAEQESKGEGSKFIWYAHIPVLLIQYNDLEQGEWKPDSMGNQLFDAHEVYPLGSLKNYFAEVSDQRFLMTGKILGNRWVKIPQPASYWNLDYGMDSDAEKSREMIREAFAIIDKEVDFSIFDLDRDGIVEHLMVIHSGQGGENGGKEIWSHSSTFQNQPLISNDIGGNGRYVVINNYAIHPAVNRYGTMEGIEVFAHEFGHALGLPDLYDRDRSSRGLGHWALMSANTEHDETPLHMCAWSKEIIYWLTPENIRENTYDLVIPPVERSGTVYRIWAKGNMDFIKYQRGPIDMWVGREYFLIENRQQLSWDREVPGNGLLIWHVNNEVLTQNDDEAFKLVDLEEADLFNDLDLKRNFGDEGDPWPGSSGNRFFTSVSLPGSRYYDGSRSGVAIRNIREQDTMIVADVLAFTQDLQLADYKISDTVGDRDGIPEPAELIKLSPNFANYGPETPVTEIVLRTDDPGVTLSKASITLPSIPTDSILNDPALYFSFSIDAGHQRSAVRFTLETDTLNQDGKIEFSLPVGAGRILLLDNASEITSSGQRVIEIYEKALRDAGIFNFDTLSTVNNGFPNLETLEKYTLLIWLNGGKTESPDPVFRDDLLQYLSHGRALLVSARNMAEGIMASGSEADIFFMNNVLKTEFGSGEFPENVQAVIGGPGLEELGADVGTWIPVTGGTSAENQSDADLIYPLTGGEACFHWLTDMGDLPQAAVRFDSDEYRSEFWTFGLEGIDETSSARISRMKLLASTVGWLQRYEADIPLSNEPVEIPEQFILEQNYPNPFNASTMISFRVPRRSLIDLEIFDVSGRRVKSPVKGEMLDAGRYTLSWDGTDESGHSLSSGLYFCRLKWDDGAGSKKLLLIK